jgi:hypothetical protein
LAIGVPAFRDLEQGAEGIEENEFDGHLGACVEGRANHPAMLAGYLGSGIAGGRRAGLSAFCEAPSGATAILAQRLGPTRGEGGVASLF